MREQDKIKQLKKEIRELNKICKYQADINKMLVAALIMTTKIKKKNKITQAKA